MTDTSTKEGLESIFETFKRDALIAGIARADWDKTIDRVKALAIEALEMRPRPISEALDGSCVLAWGQNTLHFRTPQVVFVHSNYNGHKRKIVTLHGECGFPFSVGDKDAPTHFVEIPDFSAFSTLPKVTHD